MTLFTWFGLKINYVGCRDEIFFQSWSASVIQVLILLSLRARRHDNGPRDDALSSVLKVKCPI
jgi:hypothetical protein